MKIGQVILTGIILLASCDIKKEKKKKSELPEIKPDIITEQTANDSDDPAIWINSEDKSKSIIFGTDKDTNGAIYAFDLDGKIIEEKTIRNIKRPNNIDLAYGFSLNDSTKVDVIAFTEREEKQIRLFSVPDMKPLDNGGFKVFSDDNNPEFQFPMGIAFYKSPVSQKLYVIVGRKDGPKENYLYQYELLSNDSSVTCNLVRKFGKFSGIKEIEAIAIDNEFSFIYYSDEKHCIRKYYAEPEAGNEEIACFGGDKFKRDIEGIAIAKTDSLNGFLIVSNQQKGEFNLFDRQTNKFVKAVNLTTTETDGCDVTTTPLGKFSKGLFVAMNDNKNFYFYDLDKILK